MWPGGTLAYIYSQYHSPVCIHATFHVFRCKSLSYAGKDIFLIFDPNCAILGILGIIPVTAGILLGLGKRRGCGGGGGVGEKGF